MSDEILKALYDNTIIGKAPIVKELTDQGIAAGMNPLDILYKGLIPALQEVGRRFEIGDFFVPEMLLSARAMQGALTILKPLLAAKGEKTLGKVVMGTVKGDVHDIGKNLCNIMLEGAGFEVYDLGVNTSPEKFVAAVQEHQADIVGFSAFLTTTMPMFKVNIAALKTAGFRDKGAVVGGGDRGVRQARGRGLLLPRREFDRAQSQRNRRRGGRCARRRVGRSCQRGGKNDERRRAGREEWTSVWV